jgi:glutaconate CoA-transferase, subunit B
LSDGGWTADEMMTVAAARHLADGEVCFVGIGMPSLAANLARRTHAPGLVLVYESGTIGSKPREVPLSIGDGELAETADAVVSVPEIFNYWLQPGRIDVGFLGAAELDRRGDINTTVIGPYETPRVRLPGAGGAPEIARSSGRVVVIMRHSRRALVERVGFRTSLGDRVATVITDIGVLRRDPERHELVLTALHPGSTADQARAATGWDLAVAVDVAETEAPTDAELGALRRLVAGAGRAA